MNRPIGLYDSGIGGLSVVREVFRQLPHESVHYIGDTARVPYGSRSEAEILAFNREIVDELLAGGVKLIVIACNTSSAMALPMLRASCPVPVIGLIGPGAEAAHAAGRRIGVIATQGTVRSGAYGHAIRALDADADVREVACPSLVPLVEGGRWDGPEAIAVVRGAIAPFIQAPPEGLVLGCTHYPHLAPLIRDMLPGVTLVDPASRAVAEAARVLREHGLAATGTPSHHFAVTGDPAHFQVLADRLFPGCTERVTQVLLPSLNMASPA
jgi:glutamate racemase